MDIRTSAIVGAGIVAALVAGLMKGEGVAAQSVSSPQRPVVNTTGCATIRVRPDSARLFLAVSATGSTANDARSENGKRVQEAQSAIASLRIPGLKMKTSNVSLDPVMAVGTPGRGSARITGYHATNQFTVLISDAEADRLSAEAARVLDTAVSHGANSVQQIVFFREDDATVRRQAMTAAVQDALKNARALASGSGGGVGRVLSVDSDPDNELVPLQVQTNSLASVRGATTPVLAGNIEITSRVRVSVALD